MGEVVSLTIQLSAAGATLGAGDATARGDGVISRESLSRHSSRSAGASSEQARSFSIASVAPWANAVALAIPNTKATQSAAILIACPAACALGGRAIPAPPGSA